MLTKRQKEVFDYIRKYLSQKAYSPSLEEIKEHLKLSSFSSVHYLVEQLRKKGYLKKEDFKPRSIDICENEQMIIIPLLGTIAAGQPIEAIQERETIAIPRTRLPKTGNFYSLRVRGNSMIDENIEDGDLVVVKNQPTANNGERVVALLDNQEVTLKKLYREKNHIRLQPANKTMESMIVKSTQLTIQGIVVDVIKDSNKSSARVNRSFPNEKVAFGKVPIDQIIIGDAIENMKRIPNATVDLIVADPPYNLSQGNEMKWKSNSSMPGFGGDWKKVIESWDNMPLHEYMAFSKAWITEAKRILKPTGSIWVFGTYHNIGIINLMFQLLGIEIINEVVWYKRNAFPNLAGRRLTASHETLLWGHPGGSKKRNYHFDYQGSKNFYDSSDQMKMAGKQMRTVWDIPNNKNRDELKYGKHPTQKPLSICKRIISLTSKPGDLVLSPFSGAGTECVAAKELDRHYLGFELEKEYAEISKKRLDNCKKELKLL